MDPWQLRPRIAELEAELDRLKVSLAEIERTCRHDWREPKYDPIHRPAYTSPNTMGPIRNGEPALPPLYVPAETISRWTRECRLCGKTESTTLTNQQVTKVPRF